MIYQSFNKKWFDKECRLKRHELRKLSNLKHRDPLNITLREKYYIVLKQYKNVPKQKRKEYYHTKISELENMIDNSNSRNFWSCPKSMAESLRSFIVCIVLCVCFYLKLTRRISRLQSHIEEKLKIITIYCTQNIRTDLLVQITLNHSSILSLDLTGPLPCIYSILHPKE